MCDDRVPIDLEGTMELPVIPERQFIVDYFKDKHIDNDVLNRYLFDMAQDFMQGLQARDYDKLTLRTEKNFLDRLRARNEQCKIPEWFEFEKVEYDPERVVCVDKLFYKGLGVERATNADQMDYRKESSVEQFGIRQYFHKFDLGMQDYYYMNRYKDGFIKLQDDEWVHSHPDEAYLINREVKEGWYKMRQEMLAKQFRYLLRVTL